MINKIFTRIKTILRDIIINFIAASSIFPMEIRYIIYKLYGLNIKTKRIYPGCFLGSNVSIGANTFVNYRCFFDSSYPIFIGDDCAIAMEVMFCTSTHNITDGKWHKETIGNPIKVGNRCWIGTRVTILPGVTIGDNCIIAAGSVITKDCENNGLYAGVPAKRIKDLIT